jgi:hypothetical protein
MKAIIRKNDISQAKLMGAVADEIFRHLESRPDSARSRRVAQILELLSRIGRGDAAAFFGKGDLLSRYKWHYGLTYSKSRGLCADLVFTNDLGAEAAWEYRAVRFLMGLVPNHINRLRRCEGCNLWLFAAGRADQVFCKRGACRQAHYDDDPERRKRKAAYMKKLRADVKDRAIRDDRRAEFTKGKAAKGAELTRKSRAES